MRKSVLRRRAILENSHKDNVADAAARRSLAHTTQNRVRGVAPPDPVPAYSQRYNHQSEKYKERPDPTALVVKMIKSGKVGNVRMK